MRKNEDWYIDPPHGDLEKDKKYHQGHSGRSAFTYCWGVINALTNSRSILDVGCKSSGFLRGIDDRYEKIATDICRPALFGYDERKVQFIHGDFLTVDVPKCDVVCCFEVLEHIRPDKRREFAEKLLQTAEQHLFVTIPYMWKGTNETEIHPHDGYNESNLMEWFWPYYPDSSTILGSYLIAHFDKDVE